MVDSRNYGMTSNAYPTTAYPSSGPYFSNTVLEAQNTLWTWVWIGLLFLFLIGGILLVWWGLKKSIEVGKRLAGREYELEEEMDNGGSFHHRGGQYSGGLMGRSHRSRNSDIFA